jgi:hypothetical protein
MQDIIFESESPDGKKLAIFEDNGSSAWLYLASARNHDVEKDVFVYSPQAPCEELNRTGMQRGEPPILTTDCASERAMLRVEDETELSIVWSASGRSIALFHRDEALAAIYEDDDQGYSKALCKRCGFGKLWSDEKFAQHFDD